MKDADENACSEGRGQRSSGVKSPERILRSRGSNDQEGRVIARRHYCAVLLFAVIICSVQSAAAEPSLGRYSFSAGWATFGFVAPPGAVTSGVQVESLPTQTDVKTRWPDGSMRFGIITAKIPDAGSYDIFAAAPASGVADLPAVNAVAEIVVNGTTYTAALPSSLSDQWLNGPLVREARAISRFTPEPPAPAKHLRVIWDVRTYSGGGSRISVTFDNTMNVADANAVLYSVAVKVNGSSVFSRTSSRTSGTSALFQYGDQPMTSSSHGLTAGDWVRVTSGAQSGQMRRVAAVIDGNTVRLNSRFESDQVGVTWEKITFVHPYLARWRRTFRVGSLAEAEITPDFTSFVTAGALPAYLPTVISPSRSIAGPNFAELGIGDLSYPLALVGDREEIGLYPAWVAQYLVHKRQDQRAYVLKMGDLAGSFSIHSTEWDGRRTNLDNRPGFFFGIQGDGNNGPAGGGPNTYGRGYYGEDGAAHQPSLAYVPYLLTGDRYYLDELKSWADFAMMSWSWLRNDGAGLMTAQQLRGLGWGLRDLADAAVASPDGDPDKPYFASRIHNNLADLESRAAREPDPLGGSLVIDQLDAKKPTQIFMQAFFLWALDHVVKQGFPASAYRRRIANYYNTLTTPGSGFTVEQVTAYLLNIADSSGRFFNSYTALRDYNFGSGGLYPNAPIPTVGNYGVSLRVILTIAVNLGLSSANANLATLMAYTDGNGSMTDEVNRRSQYAITDGGQRPSTPSGVRLVR
jgi:hypothetical protein